MVSDVALLLAPALPFTSLGVADQIVERRQERPEADAHLTRFGHFDDEAREYVITRPDTPLPWINYLGSEEFFGAHLEHGGRVLLLRDARLRRLIRYRYNDVPADTGGRFLYVRDDETGEYWSPSWQPVRTDLEDYRCRHGLGYTVIGSADGGHRDGDPVPRAARRDARDLADADHQPPRRRRGVALALRRGGVLSVGRLGRPDELPTEPLDRRGRGRRRRDLPHDRVPGAAEPLRVLRLLARSSPASTPSGRSSSGHTEDGIGRSPWSAGVASDSIAHGWAPIGSHHVGSTLAPVRRARSCSSSATRRTRRMRSSTLRDRRTLDTRHRPPRDRPIPSARSEVEAAFGRVRDRWTELLDVAAGLDAERARRPDGERVEPVPVHGDVQPVPLGVAVRHGDRSRDRIPGLEPGPPRVRAHGARAGAGTDPRSRGDAARRRVARTTSTSRSRSAGTTRSARASTTTRSGSSSPRPRT